LATPIPTKTSSGTSLRASFIKSGKPPGTLELWFVVPGVVDPPVAAGFVLGQPTTANITHNTTNTTAIFFIPFYSLIMISSIRTYVL
jgi:hypothetical protein